MQILSHRGYWKNKGEKNTRLAFERSIAYGFGFETDVRDCAGQLVVSHDPALGSEMTFPNLLSLLEGHPKLPLAINVKADGLAELIHSSCQNAKIENYFVFDMSLPDTRLQIRANNPIFFRMSEFERDLPFPCGTGVWLDCFGEELWYEQETIETLLAQDLEVCIVSMELHLRDMHQQWEMLRPFASNQRVMLCTDYPEDAHKFFSGEYK